MFQALFCYNPVYAYEIEDFYLFLVKITVTVSKNQKQKRNLQD